MNHGSPLFPTIFEYVRGVVFVVVIFSINSCDNLYICII